MPCSLPPSSHAVLFVLIRLVHPASLVPLLFFASCSSWFFSLFRLVDPSRFRHRHRQDVAVIWRLSKTMQLGNGVGASTYKSADGSVQLKVGKVAPKSNDVAKSSLDFSQLVHFFARCCLAAFPSLGPDQAVIF